MALLTERMGIDFWEVVEAAKTKPFGFMPFYPGAGVGGHCIPVDPYYLSWKAREYDYYTEFIELAGEVNQAMTHHVVDLTSQALSLRGKPLKGAGVLVLGVAFKRDIDDARNSPAERIIELLLSRGAQVGYHDSYVPSFRVGGDVFHRESVVLESVQLTDEELAAADCVVIVTDHRGVDYERVVRHARLIVDTRNTTADVPGYEEKIVRLGAPLPQ
jgi:UDP-N-acetyl-D-glucosamine dehydrogenase